MEAIDKFIFQVDSDLVKKYYNEADNIKVIDVPGAKSDLCVIYFSSNEIYYPNTPTSFISAIVNRDKYEWQNNLIAEAGRHIFVRDLQKQWYIEGVSSRYNTPELVAAKLKELSSGFKIYTIGSSAGGYAALLFGSLLNADRVYAFNAQLDLNLIMAESDLDTDPLLFKYVSDSHKSRYFEVSNFLKSGIEYFYFQSANNSMDVAQHRACANNYFLNKIEFATSNHGFPFLRHDLKYVLELGSEQLKKLKGKKMHPFIFSTKIHGMAKAGFLTSNAIRKRMIKKVTEKMHS